MKRLFISAEQLALILEEFLGRCDLSLYWEVDECGGFKGVSLLDGNLPRREIAEQIKTLEAEKDG